MNVNGLLRGILRMASGLGAATMLLMGAAPAGSQETWPARPVKFIVNFPPGGPMDIMARSLGEKLTATLKQPVVVENKPGAAGNIGVDAVAKSAPDGYTVLMTIDTPFTVNPNVYKVMPFKSTDLKPLLLIGASGSTVGVHPSLGVKSLAEMLARGKNEAINFSSAGNGSPGHLTSAILAAKTGVKVNHVPYKGNTPAVMAIASGEVQAGILATPGMLPSIQANRIVPLATTGTARSSLLPNVPTVTELGLPDLLFEVCYIAMVPAATPDTVVATLQRELSAAVKASDFQTRMRNLDVVLINESAAQTVQRLNTMRDRYAPVIKATGLTAE